MPTRSALVADDDPLLRRVLRAQLDTAGFHVDECVNGVAARRRLRTETFDLVILSVDLPLLSGLDVCASARRRGPNQATPIVLVSTREKEADTIAGLDSGADAYVAKPFGLPELMARIGAVLRRHERARAADTREIRRVGNLDIDLGRRTVSRDGVPVALTRQEFDVLERLTVRPGLILTRAALVSAVWARGAPAAARTVDAVISRLRRKLEPDPVHPRRLLTVRGVGYRFSDA